MRRKRASVSGCRARPDPAITEPLFDAIRADKAQAIELLRQQAKYYTWADIPRQPGDGYEGTVIFAADTDLPFPSEKWHRLPDGRIEATLTLYDLRVMKEIRDAMRAKDAHNRI